MAKVPRVPRAIQAKLGARIKALREERKLTQEAVAELVGISQKYVSELERGQKSPSWAVLVDIAHKGFDVKLASLLFGIDDDAGAEIHSIVDVLAGRSKESRQLVLGALAMLVRAGEMPTTPTPPAK